MKKLDLCLPLRKKYRSHFEIMASMLEAVKDNGVSRFPLMKHLSTNSTQLKKYLESLIEMGFIEMDIKERRVLYRASHKGLAFLRQYNVLREMLLDTHAKPYSTMITQTLPQLKQRAL